MPDNALLPAAPESFARLPALPPSGRFRGLPEDCQIEAQDDLDVVAAWLREHGNRSPTTFSNYRKEIERLILWARSIGKAISGLTRDDLNAYDLFLRNPTPPELWIGPRRAHGHPEWRPFAKPLASTSIEQAFDVLRSFFSYAHSIAYLRVNPLSKNRIGKTGSNTDNARELRASLRHLPEDLWDYLVDYIAAMPRRTRREKQHADRARWIFHLFYETSARISEIVSGKMSHFSRDEKNSRWLTVTGKGNNTRKVPVSEHLYDELMRYRLSVSLSAVPDLKEDTALVLSVTGRSGMTRGHLLRIIQTVCRNAAETLRGTDPERAARLEGMTAHWIRHTRATHVTNEGTDLSIVQELLGHKDISTTRIYRHLDKQYLHEAITGHKSKP